MTDFVRECWATSPAWKESLGQAAALQVMSQDRQKRALTAEEIP